MSFENPAELTPDPLVGTTIAGRYKIVCKLGEGGMGCVYVGEQHLGATVRKVAIKTLHPHLSHDPKIMARFERECGTVAELHHPNTIQVFDFGKTEQGTLYIVMEFVEGRSVADVLEKDGPMSPARVEKILTQVCGSLAEAHDHGIVHRDLKPDNIVLCTRAGQTDWVEVLDFGIAQRSNEEDKNEAKLTQQGTVLGTPPYMSPEQFTGHPIDARSDIYSLGVMSYEMLTGRLPFAGNTAWEWASAHMKAPPAPIESTPQGPGLPPAMKAAITRALAKLPGERFAHVNEFIAAFSGRTVVAAPGPAPASPQDFARGKTEVGTPIQVPQIAYAAPQGGPPGSPFTPQAGNHAMAFGGGVPGVPAAPSRERRGGGNKGPLLIVAGIIGVVSIGAIALAMRGSGASSGSGGLDLSGYEAGASAPHTELTAHSAPGTPATTPTAAPTDPPVEALAQITPPKPPPGGGGVKPAVKKDAGTPTPTPGGGTVGTTPVVVTPPPPAAEPKACTQARMMYGMGQKVAGDKLAEQCRAAGGKI